MSLIDVRVPHMGSVERVVLTTWHKSVGDSVEIDEALCDVSTDKVDTEIPSPVAGTLARVLAQEGEELEVGALIAQFASDPADVPTDAEPVDAASTPTESEVQPPTASVAHDAGPLTPRQPTVGRRVASPLVRKLGADAGIDLGTVPATGLHGRITRADLQAEISRRTSASQQRQEAASSAGPVPSSPTYADPVRSGGAALEGTPVLPAGYEGVAFDAVAHTPHRRAVAEHMVRSTSTAPQLTAQVDVDVHRLSQIREQVHRARESRGEGKLSYLAFIARATCAALMEHPDLNATFTEDHLLRWRPVHLGIAVDTDQGLVVPVVREAHRLTAAGLAEAIESLSSRARDRTLFAEDLRGGTFTISNSGSIGGVVSTPILNQPQVAALGVPAIVRQPVAMTSPEGDEYVAIRPVMRLGLTFDHRAVDGSGALKALLSIKEKLENWPREAYL